MRSSIPKPIRVLAVVAILAMVAVACGDGGNGEEPGPTATDGQADDGDQQGGEFSIYICEPEHMIPSNASETCGSQALSSLFRGLINYDTEDLSATFEDAVGESITTEDNQTFTVKLKDGWTFHNGDPVNAQAFVDSWNFATLATNAQQNANFLSNIQGYEDVNPPVPEG
ncbi:MAG: ABC transporter substrate-binding protein, partial [Actinobacteria bacterium]|nr:ABC transporter substrate-binding protein [Actinomycetota bacterium]